MGFLDLGEPVERLIGLTGMPQYMEVRAHSPRSMGVKLAGLRKVRQCSREVTEGHFEIASEKIIRGATEFRGSEEPPGVVKKAATREKAGDPNAHLARALGGQHRGVSLQNRG